MEWVNGLPEFSFVLNEVTKEVVIVKRGEEGFWNYYDGVYTTQEQCNELNAKFDIPPNVAEAMKTGSLFGFHVPGARPDRYHSDGSPK